jgi:hypothetical protein
VSNSQLENLASLPTVQLRSLFHDASDDLDTLRQLNEELKKRKSDHATELQIAVVSRIRALQRQNTDRETPGVPVRPVSLNPVRAWLDKFFNDRDIDRPDGGPLFRYRMTDAEFDSTGPLLRDLHRRGRLAHADREAGALFVVFGAEWFRRKAESTFHVWDKLAPDILSEIPWAAKRDLTQFGLQYWGRPLRKSNHAREFLLSIALEGGFPVRVLAEGGRSWLRGYLSQVMRRALLAPEESEDAVRTIADEEKSLLRESYRDQDFIELCVDLVLAILMWRRRAEAEARGIDPVMFLDQMYPHWRGDIPIHLPTDDDAIAKDLLNGLVREPAVRLVSSGVNCTRMLVRKDDGTWTPSLQMSADGEVGRASLKLFKPEDGRIRARPAGRLAEMLGDVIARFEPPGEDGETWRVFPQVRLDRPLQKFAFSSEVVVDLVAAGSPPKRLLWPGGEPERSDLLVFAPTDDGTSPANLKLVGRGSTKARYETLYALAPDTWIVRSAGDDHERVDEKPQPEFEAVADLSARLYRIVEPTWIGDETDGSWYFIEPKADPDERRLVIEGRSPSDVATRDQRVGIFTAPVTIWIFEDGRRRKIKAGEVFWRVPNGALRDVCAGMPQEGLVDIIWRESVEVHDVKFIQRDRQRIVLLPAAAVIAGRMTRADRAEISISGLDRWRLDVPSGANRSIERSAGKVEIIFTGQPFYGQELDLITPRSDVIELTVPLPGRDAAFVRGDGRLARPGETVGLPDLRGMTVVTPSPIVLSLNLRGHAAPASAYMRVPVETQQPLGALRSIVDELLAITSDLDAYVELEIAGQANLPLRVRRFRWPELVVTESHLQTSNYPSGAQPVIRMLDDPRYEYPLDPLPSANGKLWSLPERANGMCLAYVRVGGDVLSRPIVVDAGAPQAVCEAGSLQAAARLANSAERKRAIADALDRMAAGGGEAPPAERQWLTAIICRLNGLAATALDNLKELARAPRALTQLLVSATNPEDRSLIFALQRELPFLWLALPVTDWTRAFHDHYERASSALATAMPNQDTSELVFDALKQRAESIIALEPGLEAAFVAGWLPAETAQAEQGGLTLQELANAHISRFAESDAAQGEDAERIAGRLQENGLPIPPELRKFDLQSQGSVLVPSLLAGSAAGRLSLKPEDLLVIRRGLRHDPDYVTQAYSRILPKYVK